MEVSVDTIIQDRGFVNIGRQVAAATAFFIWCSVSVYSQYGTCFISSSLRLEFWSCFYILGNLCTLAQDSIILLSYFKFKFYRGNAKFYGIEN